MGIEKLVDFGKLGFIDVYKENFTFDVYKQLIKTATWDSYKELTARTQQQFAERLIETENFEEKEIKKIEHDNIDKEHITTPKEKKHVSKRNKNDFVNEL